MTLSTREAKNMVVAHDFYCAYWNEGGKGIEHQYERKILEGEIVVIDHRTGLMWQRNSSQAEGTGNFEGAKALEYVHNLNAKRFAGFDDWRVPTLEELMSLMTPAQTGMTFESSGGKKLVHFDPAFEKGIYIIWTSDVASPGFGWVVYFVMGWCVQESLEMKAEVKAVRSV